MESISNWGFFPNIKAEVKRPAASSMVSSVVQNSTQLIARGNGRCYGDSSLQNTVLDTSKLKKFLSFDESLGIIKCESGLLLSEILNLIVPKGFFLPVTPGTKFISIGGALASNIHGKNHHKEGSISEYVKEFELISKTGKKITVQPENTTLFNETLGGMGLTGIIYSVKLKLKPIESSFIDTTSIKAKNIHELFNLFKENNHFTYSVAWIDCLSKGKKMGRSILMLGEHSKLKGSNNSKHLKPHSKKQINIPFKFPDWVLNSFTIKVFNMLFYRKQLKKKINKKVHYDSFFYPLDKLNNWNRIYGKKGFTQYQFVIPFENGEEGMLKILNKISHAGQGSFLAVLKTFGPRDQHSSSISFPEEGYTLALDFKLSRKVRKLLDELDKIVLDYNGKIYLTKDSRMSADTFKKMYSKLNYSTKNSENKFKSLQSERLNIPNLIT